MTDRKIVRNCVATFLSRSQTTVYYTLAFSYWHVWDMPAAEWDAIPSLPEPPVPVPVNGGPCTICGTFTTRPDFGSCGPWNCGKDECIPF